jgi:hypothetical protein
VVEAAEEHRAQSRQARDLVALQRVREIEADDRGLPERCVDPSRRTQRARQAQMVARGVVEPRGRAPAHGPVSLVSNHRFGYELATEAGAARALAQLDVLEAEEICLVEEANPFEELASDQHRAAGQRIDSAARSRLPRPGRRAMLPEASAPAREREP